MGISPQDLAAAIAGGSPPAIVDVRSRAEFVRGHVPGAIHVPFWHLHGLRRISLDPRTPIVVYCGHGPRAWLAGLFLGLQGFRDVSVLAGHMAAWRRSGLPQARGDGS